MLRKFAVLSLVLVFILALAATAYADPGRPNFGPAIFADGEVFGTKGTTTLPAPNEHNTQSYDKIFTFTNGAEGQLPVAEAAPGNPMYNGGRWSGQSATWIDDLPHPKPVLTSYEEVMFHYNLGHIIIESADNYFQCPLLPAK
jgi:hypothetical protein